MFDVKMTLTPIALFVYNRLWHMRQTIEALQRNETAGASDLFIFSDGPRSEADKEKVLEVREYSKTITGFKSVTLIYRERNLGLAQSIITGVTDIINKYGQIIVLEDDMVTSVYFLKFMNEALEFYREEEKVVCIHGYIYPIKAKLPETFFLMGADCWGWATWKRGWDLLEADGEKLLNELKQRHLEKKFDINEAYPYTKMLEDQIRGKNNSWSVLWRASAFLKDRLMLHPGRSLIHNIGTDDSGTHRGKSSIFNTEVSDKPVLIDEIPLEENSYVYKEFENYLKSKKSIFIPWIFGMTKKFCRGYK